MKLLSSALLSLTSLATTVLAHGYVDYTIVGGVQVRAFQPFEDNYDPFIKSIDQIPTRHILDDGPVLKDALDSEMIVCNAPFADKFKTPAHRTVGAGQQFTFHWGRWPDDHKGPITTWLAYCGPSSCENFNPTGKTIWFKIHEVGLISGNTYTGQWASTKLINDGLKWNVNIPAGLRPGAYLIRTEILALHAAGAPQFYPSCTQIKVTGSGNLFPKASDLYKMEAVYNMGQAGLSADIWSSKSSYQIAGPRVASFVATSAEGDDDTTNSSGSGSSTTGGSSSSSSGPKKVCKAKARRKRHVARAHDTSY